MFYQVNFYERLTNPVITKNIPIENFFSMIKQSDYSSHINDVRLLNDKKTKDEYKKQIPCVTYNFLYKDYKKDENILSPTGLMYIDIDNNDFRIDSLDRSKIFCYYRSFSGRGYAIIVKIEGLSIHNFKESYLNICKQLRIENLIDLAAIKKSQSNVLSYDPNLFYNPASQVFKAVHTTPPSPIYALGSLYVTSDGMGTLIDSSKQKVRYDNLDDFDVQGMYQVDWVGKQYVKCFLPSKKISNGRYSFFLAYTTNLVWLNLWLTKEEVFNMLKRVNELHCIILYPNEGILKVVNYIFQLKDEGKLYPIFYNELRKIFFNSDFVLSPKEKNEIVISELARKKENDSRKKIRSIIDGWDFETTGKISQQKVYNNYSISKKTVEKYWKEFAQIILDLNNFYIKNQRSAMLKSIEYGLA